MLFPEKANRRRGAEADAVWGLVAGLVGGLGGSLAMATFQRLVSSIPGLRIEPTRFDVAADAIDGPAPCTEQAVDRLAKAGGRPGLPVAERHRAGSAFHYAFGAGLGASYGLLVEYVPFASTCVGVPFGATQVLVADWLAVPGLGLSGSPRRAPASAHVLSLVAHVVYGVTTELVRRELRSWLSGPDRR